MSKTNTSNQQPEDPRREAEAPEPKRKRNILLAIVLTIVSIILVAIIVLPNALLAIQSNINSEVQSNADEVSQTFEELDKASGAAK